MLEPMLVAKAGPTDLCLLPGLANRHGLVAGATGTGKTVTLQVLAEKFSRIGVPVFMADVKGDFSGISSPGAASPKMKERLAMLKVDEPKWEGCPVVFWDVFGDQGHPVRATISDMGPLLLGRLLNLNDTQSGVLTLVFKIADDNGLLLLDLKDLRAMLQYVGDNAAQFKTDYGNVSPASIGAIQRGLLELEHQGGRQVLRRADARGRRSDADRLEGPRRRQRPRRGQADAGAEALLDLSACGCSPSSTRTCRRSATSSSRSSSSSSTRRICSSTTRRRRCSRRWSRWCG